MELAGRMMTAETPDIIRAVVDAAKAGDMVAARIVLDRTISLRRGRPVAIALPTINCPHDIVDAASRIVAAVGRGELTCEEASSLTVVVEFARRAVETVEFEARLLALENRKP